MKKSLTYKLAVIILLLFTPIYSDSPKDLGDLLDATFAPAAAQAKKISTIITNYFQAASQGTLRYGDRIRLRHNKTGYHLYGSNKVLAQVGNQKTLLAVGAQNAGSWWIVKGPHEDNKRLTGDMWMPVTQGSTLRLEQEGTGLNLHSKANVFAPLTPGAKDKKQQQAVTLFGDMGIGDSNDNWKLQEIAGTTEIKIGIAIKLVHTGTNGTLHSEPLRYADGFQEVWASQTNDENDWWIVEDIMPGSAPDLNILYAVYGDLNTTNASKNTVVTEKLDAMTYNGTLRFPIQATPNLPDTALFKTFAINDPSSNTTKNLAVVYCANSSLYLHLATSEYDIIALPDFRDPKIFDLKNITQSNNDLKVLYAIYGDLNQSALSKNGGIGDPTTAIQDVTNKVQAMIKSNQISFGATPKNEIFNPTIKPQDISVQIATLMQQLKNENIATTIAQLKQQIYALQDQEKIAKQIASITPTDTSDTLSQENNKSLLIMYQSGSNIYLRIIGEKESTLISTTDQNDSILIYAPLTPVNAPAKFSMEVGSAGRIAVGSSSGVLAVQALSTSGDEVKTYNPFALTSDPWTAIPMPVTKYPALQSFRDIALSSDGLFCLLDSKGKAYRYDTQKRSLITLPAGAGNESLSLNFIAIGNSRSIWAVDTKAQTLYTYNLNKWVKVANQPSIYVAAGIDGTVVRISPTGDAFLFDGTSWKSMQGGKVDRVAVCNRLNIWGIRNGQLLIFQNGLWSSVKGVDGNVASGFKEIAINAAGTVFATIADGRVYYMGEAGYQITKILTNKDKTKIQIKGNPLISTKMTRARAVQQGQLTIDTNTQTKAGKLAKLQAKKSKLKLKL